MIKMEVKTEIKTEPADDVAPVKHELEDDDDEHIIPQKRLRRNRGLLLWCTIIRIVCT